MPVTVYLGAVAVAAAFVLLGWALTRPSTASDVRANLADRPGGSTDFRELDISRSATDRVLRPLVAALGRRGRRMSGAGVSDRVERQLRLAGAGPGWTVERVLAIRTGLVVLAATGVGLRIAADGLTRAGTAQAILVVLVAYVAPDALLARQARSRQETIERELPDVIDQIVVSVESGLGLDSAMARAARSGHGVFATELVRVLQDVQVGLGRDQALDRLLERTDVADLRHVVLAIRQAERFGLPVATTLRAQADELRDKRRARAEERAMRIPVKIVFPLVFCILPALFVVVLGPAVIDIADKL